MENLIAVIFSLLSLIISNPNVPQSVKDKALNTVMSAQVKQLPACSNVSLPTVAPSTKTTTPVSETPVTPTPEPVKAKPTKPKTGSTTSA